jgi:hypothetical protein
MNNTRPISSYDDVLSEKERLKELLKIQKIQINKDLDEIREEFRPVVIASEMFGKLVKREDGKDALVTTGTNITIDLLISKLFAKSNFFVRLLLPVILKNFTSHFIPRTLPPLRKSNNDKKPVLATK